MPFSQTIPDVPGAASVSPQESALLAGIGGARPTLGGQSGQSQISPQLMQLLANGNKPKDLGSSIGHIGNVLMMKQLLNRNQAGPVALTPGNPSGNIFPNITE